LRSRTGKLYRLIKGPRDVTVRELQHFFNNRGVFRGSGEVDFSSTGNLAGNQNGEISTLHQRVRVGGEGGIRTPGTVPRTLDFELPPDRHDKQLTAESQGTNQLSPAPLFADSCTPLTSDHLQFIVSDSSRRPWPTIKIWFQYRPSNLIINQATLPRLPNRRRFFSGVDVLSKLPRHA